eukprot:3324126-Pleurochrysis_carterae.AAC.1
MSTATLWINIPDLKPFAVPISYLDARALQLHRILQGFWRRARPRPLRAADPLLVRLDRLELPEHLG